MAVEGKKGKAGEDNTRGKLLEPAEHYFDEDAIFLSADIPADIMKRGQQIWESKSFEIIDWSTGYYSDRRDMVAEFRGQGEERGRPVGVDIVVSQNRVERIQCSCSECQRDYYRWYGAKCKCRYSAALMHGIRDFLRGHNVGDATDRVGMGIMNMFQRKQANQAVARALTPEAALSIEPRLICDESGLELSFRYGEGKKFIVKDLIAFCNYFRTEERAKYGAKTELPHSLEKLDESGKKWLSFIQMLVREEENVNERLNRRRLWGRYSAPVPLKCSSFDLFGWRLDELYQSLEGEKIEYEDKRNYEKNKRLLTCKEEFPKLKLQISPELYGKKKVFQGVTVKCSMPEFHEGMEGFYFIKEDKFCKTDKEALAAIKPILDQAQKGGLEFRVGKKNLSEFYHSLLPTFPNSVEIIETDPDVIQKNLPPQVSFTFYLDAPGDALSCRIEAKYGETAVSCLDYYREEVKLGLMQSFRMQTQEQQVVFRVQRLFPEIDLEQDELYCEKNEDSIYRILSEGLDDLAQMGELRCTERFNRLSVLRKVKFSVGVSVSNGLLDLDISSSDISREELLDILDSYRVHKRYHRLKNGDFLTLENDDALGMLNDLMVSMQISPKEFVKGKMHLPMYRTLYLDRLLEDNEEVYNTRDVRFKQLVKNFKSVKDSDFEEPESLRDVMRGYQRTGYKWLRTLADCGFGGILADEMGLGKTLQMIAVLLAVKNEGKKGLSLVVSPASLVYNWCEEFERFAPSLKVCALTGTQESRYRKLAEAGEYDVLVTSYDLLKRDIDQYEELSFAYEVIDEAQYIKNHTTAAAKAVKVIHSNRRFALTGTPIENRLSELWSIFDYLMPGFLYKYEVFRKEVELPVIKYGDDGAMQRLQRMAGPFILRRCKNDVLKDLPDKLEESRYVQLENEQQRLYDAQVVHMQTLLATQNESDFMKNKLKVLAELMKLRQICCDPSLCFDNYHGESAKLEACLDLIDSAIDGGHRMLVFSQFTSMLDILQERLKQKGIEYYVITGATSKEKRLQLVRSYNEGDTPVFLISLKAGGVGLNLTGADVVIHYDPWWNLAVQNQATDRAHRIGQTKKVTVYKMIVRHSIEEKIQKLQESKRKLAEQILDVESSDIGGMTKEELLELLQM